jgi:hypothetical protein
MFITQANAIDKALKLLDAAGCTYGVKAPDGRTFGTIPMVLPPATIRSRKRRPQINFRQTGYPAKLRPLKVGEVEICQPPQGATAQQLQKTIHSFCHRHWGSGNFTTAIFNGAVEVLRTG